MKLKGFILVGLTALILYGCNSKTDTSTCLGVTATNLIEVQQMVDTVETLLDIITSEGLTKNILKRGNELVFEEMDNVDVVVNTDEDQEFKNSYLKWRGHVMDIVYGSENYLEYADPDDMEKVHSAIVSLSEFRAKFEILKQSCDK